MKIQAMPVTADEELRPVAKGESCIFKEIVSLFSYKDDLFFRAIVTLAARHTMTTKSPG